MAGLTIHRGTHQIGGGCTEISAGGHRILIDFGANLPGTDGDAQTKDREMVQKVFGSHQDGAVLFTHYHGDHYGLFKKVPPGVPMYIGPLAKNILRILVPYIDRDAPEKGSAIVEQMRTYEPGKWMTPVPGIRVLPLYVDHSALDAYMFCIQAAGKTILFTGDFRNHGIAGQVERMERMVQKYVPKPVDLLVTEGTILSRTGEVGDTLVRSEEDLGQRAEMLFQTHKYNFVLVSSTNLDSIMEFYHNTPKGMHFVCDLYQARILLTAMRDMQEERGFKEYRASKTHPTIRVLGKGDGRWAELREIRESMKYPVYCKAITKEELERDGFVVLARKNTHPDTYVSPFDKLREEFLDKDGQGQIIYSMWKGYLEEEHADKDLLRFIGGHPYETLHTSGHAYVETIANLIKTVDPKWILPMHTERADEFASIPAFTRWKDRVKVLHDGQTLDLDEL